MAAQCDHLTADSTGEEVCQLLNGAGNGLGVFVDAIKSPVTGFIFVLAIIAAAVGVVAGVAVLIKKAMSNRS